MAFNLKSVVPWGRTYDEYVAMFSLSDFDLRGRILGCGDGPAAFNAIHTRQGGQVLSLDPLYRFSAKEIRIRINETFVEIMDQIRKNTEDFLWTKIKTPDHLGQLRLAAMEDFLIDYSNGLDQERYVDGQLPQLPFDNLEFDLAICSHLLFLYSEQLDEKFHVASILELCRVAREVRIFPLLELGAKLSRHIRVVADCLNAKGYSVTYVRVPYEFQRGAHQMMTITRAAPWTVS